MFRSLAYDLAGNIDHITYSILRFARVKIPDKAIVYMIEVIALLELDTPKVHLLCSCKARAICFSTLVL